MIGDRIAALLKSRKKTATALAEWCGVSSQAVSQWISGKAFPKHDKKDLIASFFGITPQELDYAPILSLTPMVRNYKIDTSPSVAISRQAAELMIATELANTPKSIEYRQGMLDIIVFLLTGNPAISSFNPGSCQLDAYEAGQAHGELLYAIIHNRNS